MSIKFYDIDDKPAYRMRPGSIPFVLQFNDEGEREWTPNYEASFESKAVPIGERQFRELAGDFAQRMPTRV